MRVGFNAGFEEGRLPGTAGQQAPFSSLFTGEICIFADLLDREATSCFN